MQDIGDYIFRYADATCHLWNSYFRDKVKDLSACEPLDSFEAIDRRLFYALVRQPLEIDYDYSKGSDWLEGGVVKTRCVDRIVVVPRSSTGSQIILLVGEKQRNNTAWQEARARTIGLSAAFIELFQWDRYGFLTFPRFDARSLLVATARSTLVERL